MQQSRVVGVVSLVLALMAVLTALWPQWIEGMVGIELDGGDGSLEWALVLAPAGGAVVAALLAHRGLRNARAASAGS